MEEQDERVSLLERLVQHARATAQFNVYYGRGRDRFDVRGRVAHESLFNVGERHLSRAEHAAGLLAVHHLDARAGVGDARVRRAARVPRRRCRTRHLERVRRPRRGATPSCSTRRARPATTTSTIAAADGVPYWDAGAPGLAALDGLARPAGRSVQRSRAGRQLRRRDRRAGTAAPRRACWRARGARRRSLRAGRAAACSTRCSTSRT